MIVSIRFERGRTVNTIVLKSRLSDPGIPGSWAGVGVRIIPLIQFSIPCSRFLIQRSNASCTTGNR
jgi:hypothetical protein